MNEHQQKIRDDLVKSKMWQGSSRYHINHKDWKYTFDQLEQGEECSAFEMWNAAMEQTKVLEDALDIKPEDLLVEAFRPEGRDSKPENQLSATRITHKPTGLVVTKSGYATQMNNSEMAWRELKELIQSKALAKFRGEK